MKASAAQKPTASARKRASFDLTRRFVTASIVGERSLPYNCRALGSPERCCDFWNSIVATEPDHEPDKETLVVAVIDNKLRPFAWHRVSIGTVNVTMGHPREIMRPVLAAGGYGFVLMHNHPSGDPTPSGGDEEVTRRIVDCAALFDLRFLDHVIIGHGAFFSFFEAGLLTSK